MAIQVVYSQFLTRHRIIVDSTVYVLTSVPEGNHNAVLTSSLSRVSQLWCSDVWVLPIRTVICCVSGKKQDCSHKKKLSNPSYKLPVFPLRIDQLESTSLSHPCPLCFHAFLQGFSKDSLQLFLHSPHDHMGIHRTGPFECPLQRLGKGNIAWSCVGW